MSSKAIDAAIIIAIFTGLLYFAGYIYELHFLGSFGAPPLIFMPDTPNMILSGWLTVCLRIGWVSLFVVLFTLIVFLACKCDRVKSFFVKLNAISSIGIVLFIFLLSIVIYFSSSDLGKKHAEKQLNFSPHTKFEFKTDGIDGYYRPLRLNKGNYLLLNDEDKLMIVSQNDVKKITFNSFLNKTNK